LIATRMLPTRLVSDTRSNEPSTKHQDVFKKAGEIIHDYQVIFFDLATKSRVHDKADVVRISGTKIWTNETKEYIHPINNNPIDSDFDLFAVPRRAIPSQASRIHGIKWTNHGISHEGHRLFFEDKQVSQDQCKENDTELMKEWAKWVDESALGQPEIVLVGYSEWKIEMMKMKMPPTTVKVTYIDLMERIKRSGLCRGIRVPEASCALWPLKGAVSSQKSHPSVLRPRLRSCWEEQKREEFLQQVIDIPQ